MIRRFTAAFDRRSILALALLGFGCAGGEAARQPAAESAGAATGQAVATSVGASALARCGRDRDGNLQTCRDELPGVDYASTAMGPRLWAISEHILKDSAATGGPVPVHERRCAEATGRCPSTPGPNTSVVKVGLYASIEAPLIDPSFMAAGQPVAVAVLLHRGKDGGGAREKETYYGLEPNATSESTRYLVVVHKSTALSQRTTWDLVKVTDRGSGNTPRYKAMAFNNTNGNVPGTSYALCDGVVHRDDSTPVGGFHGCEAKRLAYDSLVKWQGDSLRAQGLQPQAGQPAFTHAELSNALRRVTANPFVNTAWLNCPWGCCEIAW